MQQNMHKPEGEDKCTETHQKVLKMCVNVHVVNYIEGRD